MPGKRWITAFPVCVLISLAVGVVGSVSAAGPSLPQIINSTTGSGKAKSIDVVPDPLNLRADWWLYFAVAPEQLGGRVNRTKQLLDQRYGAQSGQFDAQRQQLLDRIGSSLDSFAAAANLQSAEIVPAPGISDAYSPGQALDLVKALRKARVDLEFEINEANSLSNSVSSALERIDRSMAAYLQARPGSPERLRRGFAIVADRTAIATSEQQLRLQQQALTIRRAQVDELNDAELVAEQRLQADASEVERLSAEIEQLEPALIESQRRLTNDQRRVLESAGVSAEDQAAGYYRRQRAIRAGIGHEQLRLQMLSLKTQRGLSVMLADPDNADLSTVHTDLDALRFGMERARGNSREWQTASERERDRAVQELSQSSAQPGVQNALDLINQDRLRLAQESMTALRSLDDELTQLDFLSRWTARSLRSNEGPVRRLIGGVSDTTGAVADWFSGITDRPLFSLGSTPITLAGLAKVVLIVVFAWVLSWLFRKILARVGHRFPKERQSLMFIIGRLAHYLIIGIGVIAGLSSIGLGFTNFALVAGALALGLGFGLQSIVNNFLSGLILFFEQTVKVGDFVELENGEAGEIKSINVRGTIVNTNDNIDIVVPNSQFIERKVTNWTLLDPFRRIHVPFRVAYDAEEDRVVEAGLEAAGKLTSTLTGVLGREPSVWLVNYGENGLDFELIVWLMPDAVKRPDAIFAAYQWEIKKALRRHDVEVPVPQREIRFRPGHGQGGPSALIP